MIVTDLTPFSQWCQARGVTSPLILDTDGATGFRSMCLPPNSKALFGVDVDIDVDDEGGYRNKKVDVVRVPLDSCIVGKDLPTLVDKLKYEKSLGEKSTMYEWLNLFPSLESKEFQSMPRFWDPERIEFVSKYDSGQLKSRLDIDQTRIDQQLGSDRTDIDAWALACVDSRSNFLPDETYSLTPLLDMFNHNPTCTTTARVEKSDDDGIAGSGTLVLELGYDSVLGLSSSASNEDVDEEEEDRGEQQDDGDWKDQLFGFFQGGKKSGDSSSSSSSSTTNTGGYHPGQEVFISYGEFDNVECMVMYGFVSETNACNLEQFKVRSIGMLTGSAAGGGAGAGGPAILIIDSAGAVDNIFNTMSLDALRLSLATPEELEDYKGSGMISDANEIEVFALVVGELDEAIYETKQGIIQAKARKDDLVV
eukprot:CAMPEP_0113477198 /NCGR_PEP_ID=MMETSP0014_2-20120614/20079_1 /TAXON_ID=2857 /ORGANISM="Nitzschia sp." /LENGTH=421 /DNA_ID=CAMNT_0000370275 /DNA_START=58 /DNA_END=1320 /DNA_ORIENTATION=- /assembly_acc=CAM_ASM_000159